MNGCQGCRWGWEQEGSDIRAPAGNGYILSFDCTKSQSPDLRYCSTVLHDVTFGENWVKITQDLYVLFLTIICESTIINYLKIKSLTKKKIKKRFRSHPHVGHLSGSHWQ